MDKKNKIKNSVYNMFNIYIYKYNFDDDERLDERLRGSRCSDERERVDRATHA